MSDDEYGDLFQNLAHYNAEATATHRMVVTDLAHRIRAGLGSLNQEQNFVVRSILQSIVSYSSSAVSTANFYSAILGMIAEDSFGVCVFCNKNHETELLEHTESETS